MQREDSVLNRPKSAIKEENESDNSSNYGLSRRIGEPDSLSNKKPTPKTSK